MNLEQIQRAVFEVIRQPLTASQGMRPRLPDGRSTGKIASAIIKPNDRLTSQERLEIYNQQYWFRLLDSFSEDFSGLRSVIGARRFQKVALAYLTECPSESFTLRNLGSRLEAWLRRHKELVPGLEGIALDMVRLEWAEVEVFDSLELPRLTTADLATVGSDTVLRLQPHLQLLELKYPVDQLLLQLHHPDRKNSMVSNAVLEFPRKAGSRRSVLPKPEKVYLVVYRLENTVYFKRLTRQAFGLLRALATGKPLADALEDSLASARQSLESHRQQVSKWFENWSTLGWFAQPGVRTAGPGDPPVNAVKQHD